MGFKAIELAPISSVGPTALTPAPKDVVVKAFTINRTDTASTVKAVLPADATIIDIRVFSPAASNAATTAVINVGNPGSTTYFVNGLDVKTAAGKIAATTQLANIFNLENSPQGSDIQITGQYAETGGASTVGGPFYVTVEYVR